MAKNTFCLSLTKENNRNYKNPCSRARLPVTGTKSPVCKEGSVHEQLLK